MILTSKEAQQVIWEEHPDWEPLAETLKQEAGGRWDVWCDQVCRHVPTEKFYRFYWTQGATETQEHRPFEHDGPEIRPTEVTLVERTTLVWEPVND